MWLFSIEFTSLPAKNRKYTSNLKWEIKGDCFIFICLCASDIIIKGYCNAANVLWGFKSRISLESKKCCRAMQYIFSLIWLKDYPSYSYEKSNTHISIFSASKIQLCAKSLSLVSGVQHFSSRGISPSVLK